MGISDIRAKVGRNPAVVDSFYLTLLQGVNQLLPLIVMPYLFATLGAGGYGHVGFALTVVQYLVLVVDFGFNYSATKDIAQAGDDRAERTRIFWAALKAKVLLMVAAVAVLLALIAFVPTFQKYSLALYCTLPMLVGNTFTFLWLFQGIGRIKLLTILNAVCKLCVLPFIFVCVKQPADFALAAFLQSSVYVLAAVVSGVVLYRLHAVDGPVGNMEDVQQALKRSFPLFVSTAASSVYTQLFVVVLAFFCSEEIIGQYSAAERLMRALCFGIFAPLNQAYFPRISAAAVSERRGSTPPLPTSPPARSRRHGRLGHRADRLRPALPQHLRLRLCRHRAASAHHGTRAHQHWHWRRLWPHGTHRPRKRTNQARFWPLLHRCRGLRLAVHLRRHPARQGVWRSTFPAGYRNTRLLSHDIQF